MVENQDREKEMRSTKEVEKFIINNLCSTYEKDNYAKVTFGKDVPLEGDAPNLREIMKAADFLEGEKLNVLGYSIDHTTKEECPIELTHEGKKWCENRESGKETSIKDWY